MSDGEKKNANERKSTEDESQTQSRENYYYYYIRRVSEKRNNDNDNKEIRIHATKLNGFNSRRRQQINAAASLVYERLQVKEDQLRCKIIARNRHIEHPLRDDDDDGGDGDGAAGSWVEARPTTTIHALAHITFAISQLHILYTYTQQTICVCMQILTLWKTDRSPALIAPTI